MRDAFRIAALAGGILACPLRPDTGAAQTLLEIVSIGPRQSSLDPIDPDGASGGRVNGLAVAPTSNAVLYAVSEWGGLFKSIDAGRSWQHLPGHTPVATWDVEVDPANANRVYATSFYDGRVTSRAGINVSNDAGVTWTKPAAATPPAGFCADPARRAEPSAFGIAIDPAAPQNVYIGTNCGLALSHDSGATWSFVDPSPADPADDVWDVVIHHGGIIDLCGDDGHARSTDGGLTWTTAIGADALQRGRCSIAASPDEAHVLFAVVGVSIFESDDGGASWPVQYTNPSPQGRIPFVETNQRSGAQFDLWFGDVSLHRGTCTTPTPPVPGGSGRCQPSTSWVGGFTRGAGGHDDTGGILFDRQVAQDACPLVYSSDGGVYFNTLSASPACHNPAWEQPNATPQALWQWDMAGVAQPGLLDEELYFGLQDNGTFGSVDAGQGSPGWNNEWCCDGFDMVAEPGRVLSTVCCWGGGRATRLFISSPGLTGATEINTYPPGSLRAFEQLDSIVNFAAASYAVVTTSGVFVTRDIGANPIVWTQIGTGSTPPAACGIQGSRSGGTTSFFLKNGGCDGDSGGTLWRHIGTGTGGMWQQVTRPGGGSFGVYAVDPANPSRIIASDLAGPTPQMVMTSDGGATWSQLPQLDTLMTGGGAFRYRTTRGPLRFTGIGTYPQPTLVAFDPADTSTVVAAGADSGVFLSRDGAATWRLLTDPLDPAVSGVPHVPRARYAHFEHGPGQWRIYLGTQGRGVWRITLAPGWHAWESFGGTLASKPECLSTGATQTDCWAKLSSGALGWWRYDGRSQPTLVSLGGQVNAAPSCLRAGGKLHCFIALSSGQLGQITQTGSSWGSWQNRGDNIRHRPACVSVDGTKITCVALGGSGKLRTRTWSGTSWGSWTTVAGSLSFTEPPICYARGGGIDCLVVDGASKAKFLRRGSGGSWAAAQDLGGAVQRVAACVAPSDTTRACFFQGADRTLRRIFFGGSNWGTWQNLGGALHSAPSCVPLGATETHCFGVGGDGTLRQRFNRNGWQPWASLGGMLAQNPPACTAPASSRMNCFARSTGNQLDYIAYH